MQTVEGLDALQRKLMNLEDKGAQKAIRAGIRAGLSPVAKALRAAVNSSGASPAMKREARKLVGRRYGKAKVTGRTGSVEAKVGFGVGMRPSGKKARARAASKRGEAKALRALSRRPGVGISQSNIHWFVLGTKDRRQKKGRRTGRIPALLAGLAQKAAAQSSQAALEAARVKIKEVIESEAKKTR